MHFLVGFLLFWALQASDAHAFKNELLWLRQNLLQHAPVSYAGKIDIRSEYGVKEYGDFRMDLLSEEKVKLAVYSVEALEIDMDSEGIIVGTTELKEKKKLLKKEGFPYLHHLWTLMNMGAHIGFKAGPLNWNSLDGKEKSVKFSIPSPSIVKEVEMLTTYESEKLIKLSLKTDSDLLYEVYFFSQLTPEQK
ncbi:hypothetical protein GW915_10710 [bacterium]|nr:hypothetical protein [bacterium]